MESIDPFNSRDHHWRELGVAVRQAMSTILLLLVFAGPGVAGAQDRPGAGNHVFWIGVANGSEAEIVIAKELRELMRKHNVDPWIITRKVIVDEEQIPHSHPILTIHTRYIGDEQKLLSAFVHEQLHWLEDEPWLEGFQSAMQEFEELFPVVPSSAEGGARNKESTYRHLLVCDMELQALSTLIGEDAARDTLAQATHYQWIYEKVLSDAQIREISLRHGFNVERGIPSR